MGFPIHWLILITIGIVFIQSFIYKKWGLSRLEYARYFAVDAAFEGEEIEMVEKISNFKILPLPWIKLESSMHAHLRFHGQPDLAINSGEMYQNHKSLFSLMPYKQITRKHKIRCTKRGWYFLNSAAITCGDLIGIHTGTKNVTLSVELLVYPKPYPLEDIPFPSHSWQGDVTVKRWIVDDPFVVSGVREYRSGDPLNRINWHATARSGQLQVQQRDFTANPRLLIAVNTEVTEKMWDAVTDPELIERGISYAAALAQYAIGQGVAAGFACNGYTPDHPKEPVFIEPRNGRDQLTLLFETMAKLAMARSIPFDTFLERLAAEGMGQADLLLITSFVSDNMQRQIHRLRDQGHSVTVIPLDKQGTARSAAIAEGGR